MADWYTSFWASLEELNALAWPDLTAQIRVTQLQDLFWRTEYENGKLVSPFVINVVPQARHEPGWGAGKIVYRQPVTVYYVFQKAKFVQTGPFMETKASDYQNYIFGHSFTGFQLPDDCDFAIDNSKDNPIMTIFREAKLPLAAVMISFSCLAGYIP